jgi:cytochrome c oxidase assembly protein subunit 15
VSVSPREPCDLGDFPARAQGSIARGRCARPGAVDAAPRLARYAWGVVLFNIAVILWGAFVRATGSGAGCGAHWPMCNGEVVPRDPAIETVIELTHRVTSGVALVMVVALVVLAYRWTPARHPARAAATTSLVLMLLEAAIGASIVLLRYVAHDASAPRAIWVGLHLVNTFLLVGALVVTAMRAGGVHGPSVATNGRTLVLVLALGLTLVVGASGAITALGDTLFPAGSLAAGMEADLSPGAHFLVRLRVIHPLVAVSVALLLMGLAGLVSFERPSPPLRRAAIAVATTQLSQIALGLLNLVLLAPIAIQIAHLLFADLAWIALVVFVTRARLERPSAVPAKTAAERAIA